MVGGQSEKIINSYRGLSSSLLYTLLPLGTSVDMHDFFYKKAFFNSASVLLNVLMNWTSKIS